MKKYILSIALLIFSCVVLNAQQKETKPNVILITLDGLRWQELFGGADSLLISNKKCAKNITDLKTKFWANTPEERREILFPFIWSTIKEKGQIYGNRKHQNYVNLTNNKWFSYPGYNEILTGKADDERIVSNSKLPNPNTTILEIVNQSETYKNKVAAFTSWDVFPYIINETRSGVPVNAGFDIAEEEKLTENEVYLNKLQKVTPSPWGSVRLDVFTHHYALEYLKKNHPKFTYISYGETDDFAHDGNYSAYLQSANTTDGFIKELWEFTRQDDFYKNNTTFIITTDHGRGTNPIDTWRSHGKDIKGADEVWLIAFGNKIKSIGEQTNKSQLYSNQIARTIAEILGVEITDKTIGEKLKFIPY